MVLFPSGFQMGFVKENKGRVTCRSQEGKSDISISVLLAPFLHGHLMLVVYPHQNSQLPTLSTQSFFSSYCGYPPFLYLSNLRMILASTVASLLPYCGTLPFFSLHIAYKFANIPSIKLPSYYLECSIHFFLKLGLIHQVYDHSALEPYS